MTAHFIRSASRWSTSRLGVAGDQPLAPGPRPPAPFSPRLIKLLAAASLFGAAAFAQLPAGPGKAETEKLCGTCHEIERSLAPRQDRNGWKQTVDKMIALGASGSEKDFEAVLDYLSKNYPAPEFQRLNVNTARPIELESTLGLPRSQVAKIVEYREKNGPFKSIDALKKVPGVDAAKIEAKKDRLAF